MQDNFCAHINDKHMHSQSYFDGSDYYNHFICLQEATALIHHISKNLPPNTPLLNNSNGGNQSQEGITNSAEGWLENLLLRSQDINGIGRFGSTVKDVKGRIHLIEVEYGIQSLNVRSMWKLSGCPVIMS